MTDKVNPLAVVHFGAPQRCPLCGGELAPAFGQRIEEDGTRRPILDPTRVRCRDCFEMFEVDPEQPEPPR